MKKNYDKEFLLLKQDWLDNKVKPKLLIHACCAPCSTYVIDQLAKSTDLTIYFFNPNIHPEEEYLRRAEVTKQFINQYNQNNGTTVNFITTKYEPKQFLKNVKEMNLANYHEGEERCLMCFEYRLSEVAKYALNESYDYFGTTLTISPKKNANQINQFGLEIAQEHQIKYLVSDFKKREGYLKSIELCKQYGVYRQSYCGCGFAAVFQNINFEQIKRDAIKFLNK